MESNLENDTKNVEKIEEKECYSEEEYQKGLAYLYGSQDVKQNSRKAFKHFLKAAKYDHVEALFQVGNLYMYGEPTILRNCSKALEYFKRSAEQGLAIAQFNLFQCYFYGYGIEPNVKEAIKYCELAAKQGYLKAQVILGDFYRYGVEKNECGNIMIKSSNLSNEKNELLVEQDIICALKWYDKARCQGDQLADIKYWGAVFIKNNSNM